MSLTSWVDFFTKLVAVHIGITFSMKDAILETGQKEVLEGSIFMLPTFWISLCVINTSRTAYIAGYARSKFTYVLHKRCKEKFVQPSEWNL